MTAKRFIDDDNFIPPEDVARAAEFGLELHKKFNRGGTKVGWARAKQLKGREAVSRKDLVNISSYFARHEVDKKAENFNNKDNPSNGYIAQLLWGGDPGKKWADDLKKKFKNNSKK